MNEHALKETETRRYRAMIEGDIDALALLLDDDLIYTHSNSDVDTKASYLDKVRAGHFLYKRIDIEEESHVVLSDVAVLRGRMKAKGCSAGERFRSTTASSVFQGSKMGAGNCLPINQHLSSPA